MCNVLLIGPKANRNNSIKTGGVVVLFEDLLYQFNKNSINHTVIDTNKENYFNKIIAYFIIIFSIVKNIPKYDHISLHGTAKDYIWIAPVVIFFANIYNKKTSLRKFAGNFHIFYEKSSIISKIIIRYVLKNSNINFFETRYLVDYFKIFNENTYWFPNVRKNPHIYTSTQFNYKFIFIGHVKKEKGIDEILKVSNLLDDYYQIDIFGPLDIKYNNNYFRKHKVNYKGSLHPTEVTKTLSQYDVLLLPTYWKGEGYPGVIIEAMSTGLPIIATNLQGIKEMVNNKMSILIKPKNIKELERAIKSINEKNYKNMSITSRKQFEHFDSDIQTKKFFNHIGLTC